MKNTKKGENMPKNSKEQVEIDEQKVLSELQSNAKDSIDNIAKRCGFSRQKVWRIINQLEKDKKIWGYSGIVDDSKLNQKRFLIFLKRTGKPVTNEIIGIITKRTLKNDLKKTNVTLEDSYYVHGFCDWVLIVTASSLKDVKNYLEMLNKLFEKGLVSEIKMLEILFSVEKNRHTNPNLMEIVDFFKTSPTKSQA
jgi:DNA-binding Lrp family transcriptional regulator